MEPQPTPVRPSIHIQIADDLRIRIARGDIPPGTPLPTLHELSTQWRCSTNSARSAVELLKRQGLITGGRGKAPVVRIPKRRIIRDSGRHQIEKDLVRAPASERSTIGEAEMNSGVSLAKLKFGATYTKVPLDGELADIFDVDSGTPALRRVYESVDPSTGNRHSWSISYIPEAYIEGNPKLLDSTNEPWPGGTQHQLYTVGIEIDRIIDEVTAVMPTTVDLEAWGLDDGVPLLRVRRLSIDTANRVVEVSDADYPADRIEMRFTTPLRKW